MHRFSFGHKLYPQFTSNIVRTKPCLFLQAGQFALEDLCSCQRPPICMGWDFLLSSSLSRLTRSFALKATKPRKPRSLSVVLDSSNTATRMAVSFCTCLFSTSARDYISCIGIRTLRMHRPNKDSVFLLPLWSARLCRSRRLRRNSLGELPDLLSAYRQQRYHGRLTSILAFS